MGVGFTQEEITPIRMEKFHHKIEYNALLSITDLPDYPCQSFVIHWYVVPRHLSIFDFHFTYLVFVSCSH